MALPVDKYEASSPLTLYKLLFGMDREVMLTRSDGLRNKKRCLVAGHDPVMAHEKSSTGTTTLHGTSGSKRILMSKLESLPMPILEKISLSLDDEDLSQLCKVNKYCRKTFSLDYFWQWRAEYRGIEKARLEMSWKWNIKAATCSMVNISSLWERPLKFVGDLTIIDPFKVFFTGSRSAFKSVWLNFLLRPFLRDHVDCVVTYRGVSAAFITSTYWDSDMAFEISQKGVTLGIDSSQSKFIAVIPKKLINMLKEENGTDFEGGVSVENVNGELRTNNGDFIVLDPASLDPTILTYDDQLHCADVLCAAGGCWTFTDDSSDEDEDDDDLSEYPAEWVKCLRESAEED